MTTQPMSSFRMPPPPPAGERRKVLYVVEGFTDIRFLCGLSQVSDLTMVTPEREYRQSGLDVRLAESGAPVEVDTLPGGKLRYQAECLRYVWKNARRFDVILSQEILRGSLNTCLVGRVQGVPVVTHVNIPPVEYFRCRRERGQIGGLKYAVAEMVLRGLMFATGRLATRTTAVGPYLVQVASRYSSRVEMAFAYGIDTDLYRPGTPEEKAELRARLDLPQDKFLIFTGTRISHEKDPETILLSTAQARAAGLDAVVLNLGGGYKDFLKLAGELGLPDVEKWVLGRPAAHPMGQLADYYRAADCTAQASLEEGAGMVPLESMASGVPTVCTAVGGMSLILPGYARLVPRQGAAEMAQELLWVAGHPAEAREQALKGREFVIRQWSRRHAFSDLARVLAEASPRRRA